MNNKYAVIYEPTGTGFSAYAPDLPGCIATGRTLEETRARMSEAIHFHIQAMAEDGDRIPEPATVADMLEVA
jgi:predicted RNase H-like HicB family nuclease